MLAVGPAPRFLNVTVELQLQPALFEPEQLRPGGKVGRQEGPLWINTALRIDGDLRQRLAQRVADRKQDDPEFAAALRTVLAESGALRAKVAVIRAVRELARAARGSADWAWDPRLEAVVALADAIWPEFEPAVTRLDEVVQPSALSLRVSLDLATPVVDAAAYGSAWAKLEQRGHAPLFDLHVVLQQMRAPCQAVADHAARTAARTLDTEVGARYRRLQVACEQLLLALDQLQRS